MREYRVSVFSVKRLRASRISGLRFRVEAWCCSFGGFGIGATAATEFFGVAGFREWCLVLGGVGLIAYHRSWGALAGAQANSSVHLPVEFRVEVVKGFA